MTVKHCSHVLELYGSGNSIEITGQNSTKALLHTPEAWNSEISALNFKPIALKPCKVSMCRNRSFALHHSQHIRVKHISHWNVNDWSLNSFIIYLTLYRIWGHCPVLKMQTTDIGWPQIVAWKPFSYGREITLELENFNF